MIYVWNLASEDIHQEYAFSNAVHADLAVCYAYASENNLLNVLFSTRTKGTDLADVFPLVYGKHSVCCGDYVAQW